MFHETIRTKLYITNHWILQIQEGLDDDDNDNDDGLRLEWRKKTN